MDRIESLDGSHLSPRSRRKKGRAAKPGKALSFPAAVEQALEGEPSEFGLKDAGRRSAGAQDLEELLDEVSQSGEGLIESQSLENIKRYRQAVRSFLDYVVSRMLVVEERTSGSDVLRRKRFTQVKVIDRKLERLVSEVLQTQGRQLEILERIDEIHGLLVDLLG